MDSTETSEVLKQDSSAGNSLLAANSTETSEVLKQQGI